MKRSELKHMPAHFDRYILKCDDVDIIDAIEMSITELQNAPIDKWKALGDKTYANGKWTIKEILQHLIDTERIFAYRALAYARGEQGTVLGYDDDAYAKASMANDRTLPSLMGELKHCHISLKVLFQSFTEEMMDRMCKGIKGEYSVASVGFIMPGHQRWHFGIMEEKYYPLIKAKKVNTK
ncbi:MAG: DinB family protein [Saprospiraceae bacterium]